MRRPRGITVACLVLGWLSFAGFANAFVMLGDAFPIFPKYFALIAMAYGITALLASLGLWRMRVWGLHALRAWMLIATIIVLVSVQVFGIEGEGYIVLLVLLAVVGTVFWAANRYVTIKVRNGA